MTITEEDRTVSDVPTLVVLKPMTITKQKVLEFVNTETFFFIDSRCHSVFSQMACKLAAKDLHLALQQHLPDRTDDSWSKLLDSKTFRAKLSPDFNTSFIQRLLAGDSVSEMYDYVVSQLKWEETLNRTFPSVVESVTPMYDYDRKEKLKKSIESKRARNKRRAAVILMNGNRGTI